MSRSRSILASAYEVSEDQVREDATAIRDWTGLESDLLTELEQRHGWSAASELAPYYLAAIRRASEVIGTSTHIFSSLPGITVARGDSCPARLSRRTRARTRRPRSQLRPWRRRLWRRLPQ